MTIDPRWGFWISLLASIVGGLLLCGTEFTTLFGADETNRILAGLGIANVVVGLINTALHAIPASIPVARELAKKFYLG